MAQQPASRRYHRDPMVRKMWELRGQLKDTKTLDEALELYSKRDKYCDDHTSLASPVLQEINQMTLAHPWSELYAQGKTLWNLMPGMMSGFLERQFLKFLVSISNAKKVLELGMYTGYSALACARRYHRDHMVRKMWELRGQLTDTKTLDGALELYSKRDKYCDDHTSSASPVLQEINQMTLAHPWSELYAQGKTLWNLMPGMMSGFQEGQFLKFLVSISNAKKVLELGMYTGYSALACAEALPVNGEVITCDVDPYLESLVKKYISKSIHGRKISIRIGPALDTINKLADEKQSFDIIFLDANKDQYCEYYQVIMDRGLLAPRGTIVVDNAFFQGQVYYETRDINGEGMKQFNENVSRDPRVSTALIPIRDSVRLKRRNEDMEA